MPMPKNFLKAHKALQDSGPKKAIEIKMLDGETSIYIYDEIGPWGVTASNFIEQFNTWDKGDRPVNVHINSPGGDVYDGLAIYQTLKAAKEEIIVHIDGLAASAASFIAMAGDKIIMGRNSRMMIHDASTMVYGNAQDMLETAEWLGEESDNIADIYAQVAGGSAAEWRALMKAETWYGADSALSAGLVSEVQGSPKDRATGVAATMFKNTFGATGRTQSKVVPEATDDLDAILSAMKE